MTYWVDGTRPDDSGNGETYAAAKQTVAAGLALLAAKGDILNIVNSGTYAMTTTIGDSYISNGVAGTSWTDPGFIIQGTDSAGLPALTAVAAAASASAQYFLTPRSSDYAIFRYFNVDTSAATGTTASGFIHTNSTTLTASNIRIEYIAFSGGTLGTDVTNNKRLYHSTANADGLKDVRYCYLEQPDSNVLFFASSSFFNYAVHDCVFVVDNDASIGGFCQGPSSASASHVYGFYRNTLWARIAGGVGTVSSLSFSMGSAAGDMGQANCYDNVLWFDVDTGGTPITEIIDGGTTDGTPSAGTRGYNVFYAGLNTESGDIVSFYGRYPWDADDDEANTGDVKAYETADTVLFVDPAVTYAWDPDGRGVTMTVAKDLRLLIETKSSSTGGLPGALPSGILADPDDGGPDYTDPSEGDGAVYLDVLPIFGTDLKMSLNVRMSTKKNRLRRHYQRVDREDVRWREFATRFINVATNTTVQVIMGGIETGDVLMVDSTTDIKLSIGAANQFIPAKVLVLSGGSFDELWLKNESTTNAATVLLGVVD